MKFSTQEEYGLRCLLQLAHLKNGVSLTIPELSNAERLSTHNVAKLMRVLRQAGFVESARGQAGGYKLNKPADQIIVGEVLAVLGGRLFDADFCARHAGLDSFCTHTIECSIKSLWSSVQYAVDQILSITTLQHLVGADEGKISLTHDDFTPSAAFNHKVRESLS